MSVHPRVGGEHNPWGFVDARDQGISSGSSPRGRGTRINDSECGRVPSRPVHPRVGGEHRAEPHLRSSSTPVHPRVGGEHGLAFGCFLLKVLRFIPAWAGNTTGTMGAFRARYRFIPAWAGNTIGSYEFRGRAMAAGSSPRGRGTRTLPSNRHDLFDAVHPRVGGEHASRLHSRVIRTSTVHPRVGGEHIHHGVPCPKQVADRRFIPAWAGNTMMRTGRASSTRDGRFIPAWAGNTSTCQLSRSGLGVRFIPAWAGNTRADSR